MIKIKDADMSKYCTFRCGGKADYLYVVSNIKELEKVVNHCNKNKINYFVIGNGSNLIVKDGGYKGAIIKLGKHFNKVRRTKNTITAGAGCLLGVVSKKALNNGLTGFEWACGIPGSIGGAIYMNAGAYDYEMKDVTESIKVLTRDGKIKTIENEDLNFSYRHCIVNDTKDIVLNATLKLNKGKKREIKKTMRELREKRNARQPLMYPNAGSVFKNPEGNSAPRLVDEAGLKGLSIGNAEVSQKHSGFIVNKGKCKANDVVKLIKKVQQIVYEKEKIKLEVEIIIIGEN